MPKVRLIDANVLISKKCSKCCLRKTCANRYEKDGKQYVCGDIKDIVNAPTIEAELVRHGRWIFVGEETTHDGWTYRNYRCSECGFATVEAKNFCQNCGAKMDGGAENGTAD